MAPVTVTYSTCPRYCCLNLLGVVMGVLLFAVAPRRSLRVPDHLPTPTAAQQAEMRALIDNLQLIALEDPRKFRGLKVVAEAVATGIRRRLARQTHDHVSRGEHSS